MKHVQRCFIGADHPRHFPQQVMQHDGISVGRTFKQWNGDKPNKRNPTLPLPETIGWTKSDDGKLVPKLMTLAPVPESCTEMITCGCKSGCSLNRCSCRNVRLSCIGACKCRSTGDLNCTDDVDGHAIAKQGHGTVKEKTRLASLSNFFIIVL